MRVGNEWSEIEIGSQLIEEPAGKLRGHAMLLKFSMHCREASADGSGRRYLRELASPVQVVFRIDAHALRAMAARAVQSKSGKCKAGPIVVKLAELARVVRLEVCQSCGRPELACSKDPCLAVQKDRES